MTARFKRNAVACASLLLVLFGAGTAFASGQADASDAVADVGFNETGFPIVDTPVELSMFGEKSPIQSQWEDMLFFTTMEELTNVSFTFDTPSGDGFEERKNILFASGDLPDVFFGASFTEAQITLFSGQGALQPLGELVDDYSVNLQQLMAENARIQPAISSGDGEIYALPNINEVMFDLTEKTWIRQEWIDSLGLTPPETLDEFYDVLVAFRDRDPNGNGEQDEIPLTSTSMLGLRPAMFPPFGLLWLQGFPMLQTSDTGQVQHIATMDGFKAYLEFMNRLYEERLLDANVFTNTDQELAAIGKEQRLGVYPHAAAFLYNDYDKNELYEALRPLTSDWNPSPIWPRHDGVRNGAFALSSSNPHPEVSIRWQDYLYSIEGSQLVDQGVRGVSWDYIDSSETLWERFLPEEFSNSAEYRASITPASGTPVPYARFTYWLGRLNVPHAIELAEEVGGKYEPVWDFVFPRLVLPTADQQTVDVINADIEPYLEQMEARFIVGEASIEDEWDGFVSVLEQMGVAELVEIYQRAWDDYNQN